MTGAMALDIGRDAIWLSLIVAGPVMLIGLIVGTIVAVLQALTQVQEQALVFVPKIIAIMISLVLFLPFMGAQLGAYMVSIMERIAGQ
jgi:flagellar biosynthetic protein FliQ